MIEDDVPSPEGAGKAGALEVAALAVVVLACSQLGYVGDPKHGPFIAVCDVLCALLVAVWGLSLWARGRLKEITWAPAPVWAWLFVAALSMTGSVMEAGSLSKLGVKFGLTKLLQIVLYFIAGYGLFVHVFRDGARVRRVCRVLLITTTVVVAWGLVDYLLRDDPLTVKAGFGNRNVYSAFLVMVLPLLFGIAIHERDMAQRVWVAAVVTVGACTMLGPPHVWVLLGILLWMAFVRGRRVRAVFVPGLLALALVVVALPRSRQANVVEFLDPFERGELYKLETGGKMAPPTPPPSAPGAPAEAEAEAGDQGAEAGPQQVVKKRWVEWEPALMMLTQNIALGVGAGNYQRRIGEDRYYHSLPNVKKSEPDTNNLYLVEGASMGFAGLVCLLATLALFWRRACGLWQRAGTRTERGLAAGLPAAILALGVANLFTNLFVRGTSLIWALLFAMVTVLSAQRASAPPSGRGPGAPASGSDVNNEEFLR